MQAENEPLLREIQQEVGTLFSLSPERLVSYDQLLQVLSEHIQKLINKDFHQLVFLLYRIDVSEQKLKELLAKNPKENSASLIAHLIVERLLQKIETRQQFSKKDNRLPDEEKW